MSSSKSSDLPINDDDFFDANEFISIETPPQSTSTKVNLKSSINDCSIALNLFLNNKYSQAINILIDFVDSSMYHSLGYAVLLTMKALLTFDNDDKQAALSACKKAVYLAGEKKRKCNKILSFLFPPPKLSDLEEIELHAEICYAEANLVYAAIKILSGSSYSDYIRVVLLVRTCYTTYKECAKTVEREFQLKTEDEMRKHFETGTLLGYGIFNILISLLPERIARMLNFVGFSGERKLGLNYIYKGNIMKEGLRSPLCSTTYLFYSTYTIYIIGGKMSDVAQVREVLGDFCETYPNSAFSYLFQGRFSLIQGQIQKAISFFELCISSQDQLTNFHHLCYWELMWCYCLLLKWESALKYINLLLEESSWSKLIYSYHSEILSCCHKGEVPKDCDTKMKNLRNLRTHFATKSFPMEKFFLKKGHTFINNKTLLILPIIESMYIFGVLNMIYDHFEIIDDILRTVKSQQSLLQQTPDHSVDDFMLAVFLRGVCCSRRRENKAAVEFFDHVINNEGIVRENCYLVPFAMVEKGLCLLENKREAEKCFVRAMREKNHGLESRVHYAAQCALAQL